MNKIRILDASLASSRLLGKVVKLLLDHGPQTRDELAKLAEEAGIKYLDSKLSRLFLCGAITYQTPAEPRLNTLACVRIKNRHENPGELAEQIYQAIESGTCDPNGIIALVSTRTGFQSEFVLIALTTMVKFDHLTITSSVSVDARQKTKLPELDDNGDFIVWTPPKHGKPGSLQSPRARFKSLAQATDVADSMTQRHNDEFYVMKAVRVVRPLAQTQVINLA